MRHWKLILLVLLIAGAGVGYKLYSSRKPTVEVTRASVETGDITMTIETLGTIEPLSTVTVGCEVTGRIIEMKVKNDDPVTKDQIICKIDPELADADHQKSIAEKERTKSLVKDAQVALEEQKANLPVLTEQAKQQWEAAKSQVEIMKFNFERTEGLQAGGNAVPLEFMIAKTNYANAEANEKLAAARYEQARNNETFVPQRLAQALKQAEAAADLAQANFSTTEARVERCVIRSPIDGIVLKRFEEEGATVIAALATPPLFLLAPSLDKLRVNAKVSETDIVHVDEGQIAHFKVEGKQTAEFRGKILHKRNQPEIVQGVTTYTVSMEVENDKRHTLLPGMSVNVIIECENRPKSLRVANSTLRFKPPIPPEELRKKLDAAAHPAAPKTAEGQPLNYCTKEYAWKYDEASGEWTVVPLWVGITDNLFTEVISGASAGEAFVTKFVQKSNNGFDFKEALKLSQTGNRSI